MDLAAAMKALEAAGSEKTRATYARHGVTGPLFGVSYAALCKLAKEAGPDTALALGLWTTGNHDARVLATMVADPASFSLADLDAWSKDLSGKVLADALGALAGRVPGAKESLVGFTKSPDEWIGRAGWIGVAKMASEPGALAEAELSGFISALEKGIHRAKNHVKDARLCLLISIGALSDELEAKALAVARRIGPIDVDHGDTACETPDPLTYIPKARAHRRARQSKEEKSLGRMVRTEERAKAVAAKSRPTSVGSTVGSTAGGKAAGATKGVAAGKRVAGTKGVPGARGIAGAKGAAGGKTARPARSR